MATQKFLVRKNDDYKVIYTHENGKFCYELIEKASNLCVGYWELNKLDNRSLEAMIKEEKEEKFLFHKNDDYKVIYTYVNRKYCYELIKKASNLCVGYWTLNEPDDRSLEEMIEEEEVKTVLVHENDDYKVIYSYSIREKKYCYELIKKASNSCVGYWELINELDDRSLEEMIEEEEKRNGMIDELLIRFKPNPFIRKKRKK